MADAKSQKMPRTPPALVTLAEALRPLAGQIKRRLGAQPSRVVTATDTFQFLTEHLSRNTAHIKHLEKEADTIIGLQGGSTNAGDVHRLAGRLESRIDSLLEDYSEARNYMPVYDKDIRGQELLEAVHRHTLKEVRRFIDSLVRLCARPKTAGTKTSTKANVQSIGLKPTNAPEVETLKLWIENRQNEVKLQSEPREQEITVSLSSEDVDKLREWRERGPPQEEPQRLGFWGHVGAVVLGIGIADLFFLDE